ncbi:hypothetical protein RN001_009324 [Aquatica leii]|uniref:Platelet-derived growth factor (PDGF) family profile domain-containing protein n=1 Tax=Aquatica leii TaxID=1421715 RepID=A0AAN7P6H0_9COLE|nr:hypothetical protein RN001_009324 [Aquatica leii]
MDVCKVFLYALLEIILLQLINVACSEEIEKWRMHEKRIAGFSCGPPQPRSFRLEEIMEEDELPDINVNVFPKMTVLHRCDSYTGCCPSRSKACAPQIVEEVLLTFRIFGKMNAGPKEKFMHVMATNHTRCSCQTAYDHPIK